MLVLQWYVSSPQSIHSGSHKALKARSDGLYSYNATERTGVAPIEGSKLAVCLVPSSDRSYALVASTDTKSGRDAVDIFDVHHKLVAVHVLLSPGHRAVRAQGVNTGTRSSAVVLTSGGALVSFTEKLTTEKIGLLVQKNLYAAAIGVAFADPGYPNTEIVKLYQKFAEFLYRKGDFSGAMEQYIHTIGALESSHVIFRYLDAPKIPYLVKYLERLRQREMATVVHIELLRTCYLKLNDMQAADALAVCNTQSITDASMESILSNINHKPKDALATICSLEAPQAAEVLVVHGAALARAVPRETAGVVISLCIGTYQPQALADAAEPRNMDLNAMVSSSSSTAVVMNNPYPIALFSGSFVEHPKLLRLVLQHCNRNKCPLSSSLRRTLLELTLQEWNQAKVNRDTEVETLRRKEAIAVSFHLIRSKILTSQNSRLRTRTVVKLETTMRW